MGTIADSINFFVWKDRYGTGRHGIDEQHRTIVELVNLLYHACVTRSSPRSVAKILSDFAEFAQYHFFGEERELLVSNESVYVQHRREHEEILDCLHTAMESDLAADTKRLTMCAEVRKVFARHMYSTDGRDLGERRKSSVGVPAR